MKTTTVIVLLFAGVMSSLLAAGVLYVVLTNNNNNNNNNKRLIVGGPIDQSITLRTLPLDTLPWKSTSWNVEHKSNHDRFNVANGELSLTYKANDHGGSSGASFRASPAGLPASEATLMYELWLPAAFDFVKGGKLPGFCFGDGCSSGGDWRAGSGSIRLMWRSKNGKDGHIIGYLYTSHGDNEKGNKAQGAAMRADMHESGRTGIGVFNDGSLPLKRGAWNSIKLHVKLNDKGKANGVLEIQVNGKKKRVDDVAYRAKDELINSVNFVSFFGGGDSSWDSPRPQTVKFRDVKIG